MDCCTARVFLGNSIQDDVADCIANVLKVNFLRRYPKRSNEALTS
jgi:hypothetical protein